MGLQNKLTATKVKGRLKPGRHSDGGGLYLNVSKTDARSWVFMWSRKGKRREIGLGSILSVSLSTARDKADLCRRAIANGVDPKTAVRGPETITFADAATDYMKDKVLGRVHRANELQWKRLIEVTAKDLKNRDVRGIETSDILNILRPIWLSKAETARKSRARLENLLDYTKGRGWRDGENPARWKGNLSALLPTHDRSSVKHHAAMPVNEMPSFVTALETRDGIASVALMLLILTATRTSEALLAEPKEFDMEARLWSIPASRMKNRKPHTVPLSLQAAALVEPLVVTSTGQFVFPGAKDDRPLSNMAMANVLKRMGVFPDKAVPHGFRSTFRDWVGEYTQFPREIAEEALSHSVGNAVERAYRRERSIDKRRILMQAWADHCDGIASSTVIPFVSMGG
ncbi:MAG: tyrosine-type recombinase/integrase [Litorimonas sp.]